jgi:hypothetical protein
LELRPAAVVSVAGIGKLSPMPTGQLAVILSFERHIVTLREALNKIIHARDVRPVYDSEDSRDDPNARWGMDGQIELEGALRKAEWQATVNIFELLDGAVELIDLVDELCS